MPKNEPQFTVSEQTGHSGHRVIVRYIHERKQRRSWWQRLLRRKP